MIEIALLEMTRKVYLGDSAIDFPQEDLPEELWNKDGKHTLKDAVKSKIFKVIEAYPKVNLREVAKEIYLVGSSGTNQWQDNSDIDIHVIPDEAKLKEVIKKADDKGYYADEDNMQGIQKEIKDWYDEADIDKMVGKHEIEVFLQLNSSQELIADAAYDLNKDAWVRGPKEVGQDFNPYDEYKDILDTVSSVVGDTDQTLGELKRDVIDYEVIKQAIGKMPKETKDKLKAALEAKLQEIEASIEELIKDKKEWVEQRKQASSPATPEQALKDVEYAKTWHDENVLFKFLNRYQYLRLINDLKDMIEDGEGIEDEDVKKLKDMLGVMNTKGADDV